jgi:release factor glutamine methyltransferase
MRHLTIDEQIALVLDKKYSGAPSEEFNADAEKLRDHVPLEYVLGEAEFLGLRIDMNAHPMPPREETAFWVEVAIKYLKAKHGDKPLRIADLFAGSGNVGLAILAGLPNSFVEFHEYDAALLPGIERSLALNGIDKLRASFHASDALNGLTGEYDVILAVPPYVAPEDLDELDPEMIKHEPHLAFFADEHGRAFHRMLIEEARGFLKDGGVLFMETDMGHKEGTERMLESLPVDKRWSSVEFWPDPYGAETNVVLIK